MWQEARKQEKKIRGMMVDHKKVIFILSWLKFGWAGELTSINALKLGFSIQRHLLNINDIQFFLKRAERRREYYERIKQDPAQFLQVHGRPCRIHIDVAIAAAADSPANMMPWQGQKDNMIDRFDGRAHLDYIPEYTDSTNKTSISAPERAKEKRELRQQNYERYRILVQNDFLKIPEDRFLRTIELEELYGGKTYQGNKAKEDKRKNKKIGKGAAVAFNYDDDEKNITGLGQEAANGSIYDKCIDTLSVPTKSEGNGSSSYGDGYLGRDNNGENYADADSEDEDSDLDLDLTVDIMALNTDQRHEINVTGKTYGLGKEDFIKNLARDIEEVEELKHAKEKEEEKAMFSGRKSRRERRIIREKQLAGRKLSPPSYALTTADDANSKANYKAKLCHGRESGSASSGSALDTSEDSSNSSVSSKSSRSRRIKKRKSLRNQNPQKRNKVEFITSFGGPDPELEETCERENEKEKLHAAQKEEAKMKLKRLRRDNSPLPIIGPMLPQEMTNFNRDLSKNVNDLDVSSGNMHKRRGNNYRDNKRRSPSKSPPSTEHRHKRYPENYNDSRRNRRSRSPREKRTERYYSSNRRSYSTRDKRTSRSRSPCSHSESPRRRVSRRSRSRSRHRDVERNRDGKNRDRLKTTERSQTSVRKSRSKSPMTPLKDQIVRGTEIKSSSKSKDFGQHLSRRSKDREIKVKRSSSSSSDSSSSEDNENTAYRSKYRNKRHRSTSSSDCQEHSPKPKSPLSSSGSVSKQVR